MEVASTSQQEFDYLFKLLLIGDSGVGKSTLLLSFTSNNFEDLSPTIGVDFKVKHVTLGGKKLKLAIWDTAGQERFRTLTSSYYRGAQGIIMVYDVTRRETFTNLSEIWAKEIDLYSTNQDCIKMLVGNKVDKESERVVAKKEGIDFAREYGCLFLECSAKTRVNVEQCFEELVLKILETPSLLAEGSSGVKKNIFKQKPPEDATTNSIIYPQCQMIIAVAIWLIPKILSNRLVSSCIFRPRPHLTEKPKQVVPHLSKPATASPTKRAQVQQLEMGPPRLEWM
ncbi:unnamed protein product [Dovyalis caffra]|uniref:Uncharacterized protein n=1 Tax=Dovyalis caffra TaxID=77055 RepID=A0AAV1S951_9ROSI|nr:unnamed protein product [Dovyalis caffra]